MVIWRKLSSKRLKVRIIIWSWSADVISRDPPFAILPHKPFSGLCNKVTGGCKLLRQ